MSNHLNVLGEPLKPCCMEPMTGYYRNGFCQFGVDDQGMHLVCVVVTEAFLSFSQDVGNDLSTPREEFQFPGLKPGDKWCLCAVRWQEAFEAGFAPPVVLEATHEKVLEIIAKDDLNSFAIKRV